MSVLLTAADMRVNDSFAPIAVVADQILWNRGVKNSIQEQRSSSVARRRRKNLDSGVMEMGDRWQGIWQ
jgi:hypothetical protein